MDEIEELIFKLKQKETDNNIETLLSPIVAQELLAHIADKNDPSYERCLKANKALYLHNGNLQDCNVFPSFEVLLSKMYFNALPAVRIETYNAIIQMSYHFAINQTDAIFNILNNNLQTVKKTVDEGEAGFITAMFEFIKSIDSNSLGWQIYKDDKVKRRKLLNEIRSEKSSLSIACGYVSITIMKLKESGHNIQLSEEMFLNIANSVVKTFPEPIALFKQVIENLVNSEFNLTEKSRANFVWDIGLMFSVGKNKIDNSKLYFVTSDKAIIETAVNKCAGCYVLTFKDYIEYLGN